MLFVVDFDGTLSVRDTVDAMLEKFAGPEWETVEEEWLGTDELIVEPAKDVVAGGVAGAATKAIAHVDIAKACRADGGDELGLAILGIEGGVRDRADVDQELNGVLFQQLQEGGKRAGAVADRKYHSSKEIS